jgi:hypothetical protein
MSKLFSYKYHLEKYNLGDILMSAESFVRALKSGKAQVAKDRLKHLVEQKLEAKKEKIKAEFAENLKK